jgi:hypothetical protein
MMKVPTQKAIQGVLESLPTPVMCSGSKKYCKNNINEDTRHVNGRTRERWAVERYKISITG